MVSKPPFVFKRCVASSTVIIRIIDIWFYASCWLKCWVTSSILWMTSRCLFSFPLPLYVWLLILHWLLGVGAFAQFCVWCRTVCNGNWSRASQAALLCIAAASCVSFCGHIWNAPGRAVLYYNTVVRKMNNSTTYRSYEWNQNFFS